MLMAGRCETRVDVPYLGQEPEMMRRYCRDTTGNKGNVIGRAIEGPIVRGTMAPRVQKWCIR